MERLTEYEKIGGHVHVHVVPTGDADQAIMRLADYEDTGLTPDEIERSKMEIEAGCVKAVARTYGVDINRLREMAAADRDGRVVILPCKPGTPVHMTFCGEVWCEDGRRRREK